MYEEVFYALLEQGFSARRSRKYIGNVERTAAQGNVDVAILEVRVALKK